MTAIEPILLRATLAAALALVLCGIAVAWSADNAAKRLAAIAASVLGAMLAGAVLNAPAGVLTAAAVIGLAYVSVGAAITVRLQEEYASAETSDVDAADRREDEAGPRA